MRIKVDILTPEWSRTLEVDAIFIPGSLGEFEVLPNHAPIISTMVAGDVKWRDGETMDSLTVKGGAMRLLHNNMQICAEV